MNNGYRNVNDPQSDSKKCALTVVELDGARCTATGTDADADPTWDALVEGTPGGDLAQTSLWAASRRQLGFHCYRIAVTASDQKLVGGCMLYTKRLAPGVWLGSIPRGPLVFMDRPYAPSAIVREVTAFARRHGVWFLAIQPPEGGTSVDAALVSAGFRLGVPSIAPEATLRLDLRLRDEELLAAMRPDRRKRIRRALRDQFEVREEQDIELFHHLHALTAARQGFAPIELRNLRAQWDALAPSGKCTALIARYGGSPVAGQWLTRFAGTVTFKLAGWDASNAPANANEALYWAAIQWARRSGAHTCDLGGFDRRSAEMIIGNMPLSDGFQQTPSYFKLGFGSAPILLPRARFIFTHRLVDASIGPVAQRFLTSPTGRKLAYRFRNG
jgi:lipid II:glycine glycyltransferase (peptidoglycan interpeptide bridge formation enzyme)